MAFFTRLARRQVIKSPLFIPSSYSFPTPGPNRAEIRTLSSTARAQKPAAADDVKEEDIVIIGAGIAGLATAIALRRLGIKSKVLEQAEFLRPEGASLSLFTNAWSALDAIGVGNQLRTQFLEIQGVAIKTEEGKDLRYLNFKDAGARHELRAVERRILLETLANQLPRDAISFSSKLANIKKKEDGDTLLKFENGSQLSAKVVIACDGIWSPVARWMGFSEPKYAGHIVIRGLGLFPDGQPFQPSVNYIYGRGKRAAYVPISKTKVYWFVAYNSSSPGPKITDPSVVRQQSKELLSNWSSDLLNMIDLSPDDTLVSTPLADRWPWPVFSPSASKGKVVLVGDAWHPMTPNLGQGACIALEDSVVLAKKLAQALESETMSVEDAFRSYEKERRSRVFSLTVRANAAGKLLQSENPLVCAARNNILIPKLKLGPMLKHTNIEFEPLVTN